MTTGDNPAPSGISPDEMAVFKDIRDELRKVRHRGRWLAVILAVLALAVAVTFAVLEHEHSRTESAQTARIAALEKQNQRLIGQGQQAQREMCTTANVYRARESALWDRDLAALVATGAMTRAEAAVENALVDAFDSPRDCAKLTPLGP